MNTETKFIFDVDGTLTPSRQQMDTEFKDWRETQERLIYLQEAKIAV